jgi:phage-related protein
MVQQSTPWTAEFYRDARGKSPVQEFLGSLTKTDRAKIAHEIERLEIGGLNELPPDARPLVNHKPLWELKPDKYRVIYFAHRGRRFIILHAFTKKSRKTSPKDVATAERRFAEFMEREGR